MRELRELGLAIGLATRLPVPRAWRAFDEETRRRADAFAPLVGTLVGAVTLGLIRCGESVWPTWLAIVVALAFEAWFTNAHHERAWAGVWDALGGGEARVSGQYQRLGVHGVLAIVFGLLLRWGALTVMSDARLGPALLAAAALGGWASLLVQTSEPPSREGVSSRELLLGAIFAAPAVVWFARRAPTPALALLLLVPLIVASARAFLSRPVEAAAGAGPSASSHAVQLAVLLAAAAERS